MDNNLRLQHEGNEDEVKLLPLLKLLYSQFMSHWAWFALSAVVCTGLGWLYQQRQSRVYQRQAVMLVEEGNSGGSMVNGRRARKQVSSLMELNGISVGDNLKDEMFILTSLRLMERVVDDLRLQVDYTKRDFLHTVSLYKHSPVNVIFADSARFNTGFTLKKLDKHTLQLSDFQLKKGVDERKVNVQLGQTLHTPSGRLTVVRTAYFDSLKVGDEIRVERRTRRMAAALLQNSVTATEYDKESSLIVLTNRDVNVERNEDVINAVFNAYKRDVVDNKNRVAENTARFIDERVKLIGGELNEVENRLVAYKRANKVMDFESDAQAFASENAAARKLRLETETQLNVARFLADYLNNASNSHDLIPALNLGGAEFNGQIASYNQLMNERNRLVANSAEGHSMVREMDRRLDDMRRTVLASLESYVNSLELRLRDARSNEYLLAGKLSGAPEQEREGLDIKRQQVLKEALYTYLLNKREEVALQLAINEANVRLVEMPMGSMAPVSPRTGTILLLSLAIGAFVPAFVLWLRYVMDVTVNGRNDVERLTTIPLLGEIPHLEEQEVKHVAQLENDAPLVEAFRILRYSLTFMQRDAKVLVATSGTPGQGKSFVTANLAEIIAMAGKRVLLIDADVRKRTLSRAHRHSKGLTGFLSDDSLALQSVVEKNAVAEGIDLLPAGVLPPNPSELLMRDRFDQLVAEARKAYDFVVIDTTPMLQVADAGIVNRVADLTLFVVRVGVQERDFLPELEKMHLAKRFRRLCIVLNNADAKSGHYGYGYGYGVSMDTQNRRKRILNKLRRR